MNNFLLLGICLLGGVWLRARRGLPETAADALNAVVLNVALPAMVLLQLRVLPLEATAIFPAAAAWLLFAGAWVIFRGLERSGKLAPDVAACLILTAGLANTSFVGFPLIEALFGAGALPTAVLVDQVGSFLVVSTLGVAVAQGRGSERPRLTTTVLRIVRFPPFIALVLGLISRPFTLPVPLTDALERLATTVVPLALLAVGFRLHVGRDALAQYRGPLIIGLGYKLVLAPAVIAALYFGALGLRGEMIEVTIAEMAMAPMITGGILATQYGREPRLASIMVSLGVLVSLVTVPLWVWLM